MASNDPSFHVWHSIHFKIFDHQADDEGIASHANRFDNVSIRDLACTNTYALALSEDGKVYAWGRGVFGHLGNGNE